MKRFVYFAVAGGVAALVNFGSRLAMSAVLNFTTAIVLAYLLGMITAFFLNRAFVFPEGNEQIHKQAGWFIAVNAFALLQTVVISLALAKWIFPTLSWNWHPESVAHAIGVVTPIISSYFGHKALSFRHRSM